ncbi:hypothetical protein MLD38_022059 [Melastoma candidum]|uniref:Uncharacterized protein n=1 Tax=Melastoma candidum TaxID=119954 RepID=A0ACB9QII6_9MYRT|nr:hypothetical protein MLD38_022059 [Melastoma candidum]
MHTQSVEDSLRRDIDRAISLFNMMNAEGCPPDAIACNTLLRGLCRSGRLSAALSVVFMMYKRGFIPSIASFKNLLFHFCESKLDYEAFQIFKEMVSHALVVSRYRCIRLLSKLRGGRNLDGAQ